jgi:prevent-host-death family protein
VACSARCDYIDYMAKRKASVGSRELKTRLGTYLKRVRNGETIVVTDRGEPVAELRPLDALTDSADAMELALRRMEAKGLITRGKGGPLTPFKPIRLRGGVSLSEAIIEDREDRF